MACIRTFEWVSPPSTRSRVSGASVSPWMAATSSATWAAIPCRTASTRCPRPVDRVMPENEAVASRRHHGAASPARAGTNSTPSASGGRDGVQVVGAGDDPSAHSQRTAEAAV